MEKYKILVNPVRMRILQFLMCKDEATTNEIVEFIEDIPRTTMYRHLKVLEDNEFIIITRENRVRGTLEKVYSVNKEVKPYQSESQVINSVLLGLMGDFERYYSKKDNNSLVDMLMVRTVSIMADDKEFEEFLTGYGNLLMKYINNKKTGDRKERRITTISSPVE